MLRREEGDILVHELSPQHFRQLVVAPDRAGAILQQRADDEKFDLVGDVFEIRAMAMLVQSDDVFAAVLESWRPRQLSISSMSRVPPSMCAP